MTTQMKNNDLLTDSLEVKTKSIGKEIFSLIKSSKTDFFNRSFWASRLMDLSMKDKSLKLQLFRFVDVLPVLKSGEQIVAHIKEYFDSFQGEYKELLKFITDFSSSGIVGKIASNLAVKASVSEMAKTFIAGENSKQIIQKVKDFRNKKTSFTVDILGEVVLSEAEASIYHKMYMDLITDLSDASSSWGDVDLIDQAPHGDLPKVNVSVKISSLYSQIDPMNYSDSVSMLKERIRPIFRNAISRGAFVYLDMENYELKDLTLTVFKEILEEDEFKTWKHAGIVIQAYLRDSYNDLSDLIDWVKLRKVPVTIRLVKGAYWDYETIVSSQKHWKCPVFQNKYESDLNFEKLSKLLIDNYPYIYTAIASHNVRSIAHAKAYSELKNLPKGAIEFQLLYGMANSMQDSLIQLGERVRVYMPFGELIPGMAYLVRRLLENTANESFLRQGFLEGLDEDDLLKEPSSKLGDKVVLSESVKAIFPPKSFINEPDTDFTISLNRKLMEQAIENCKKEYDKKFPLIIDGKKIETNDWGDSINPSNFTEVIGKFAMATIDHSENAVKAAKNAFPSWSQATVESRANILFNAARIMRERKFDLSALMVLEEGKPWREADGDVSEAIDFLNYYAIEAKRLFAPEKLICPPGEDNYSFYKPRGVVAVISPWNFPLAILCGMSSAAIVSGNSVVIKPAKQSSLIAAKYMDILIEAGLPSGVCNYLPGDGRTIGNHLVKHKDVHMIIFTGSMEVGLSINKSAAEVQPEQDFVKKVVTEMGGKNAIIVDDDADLDEAVKGVVYSAFGYSGQKCSAASRVIVLKEIYESFVERLTNAVKSIKQSMAEDPSSYLGPVIDKNAYESIKKYIEIGKQEGKLLVGGEENKLTNGYFIQPTIFADVKPNARIAQEEIFGPVLSVIKADNFDHALEIANGIKFALTGALFSRSPGNIQKAKEKFVVGNLYINRGSTGAKVGRQPFGGFKMSGIGSKAGGKDYLLQFVEPRVITENTMRRGFAPD